MFFQNGFKRMLMVVPGQIVLGRFGMWMVTIGNSLQRDYAGWNKSFRLRVDDVSDQHTAYFHVSDVVTRESCLTFVSPNSQPKKQTAYIKELFNIQGVCCVILHRYYVEIRWGKVFTSKNIIPQVETILFRHMAA